jgi:hypothetical protein
MIFLFLLVGCQKEGLTNLAGSGGAGGSNTGGALASGGSVGSGGAVGVGGNVGAGGSIASGGVTGQGGGVGGASSQQGGTLGSGGAVGMGGVLAAGGATSTGGVKGSGGLTGKGGVGGTGGAAGRDGGQGIPDGEQGIDGGETCSQLVNDYANALVAAKQCMPGGVNQCQKLVSDMLSSCPGCDVYVNDSTTLTRIRTQWTNQGCAVLTACPAIACVTPGPSTCTPETPPPTDGGTAGMPAYGLCISTLASATN